MVEAEICIASRSYPIAGFGQQQQQQQQQNGSRNVAWRKTPSQETSGGKYDGSYNSISAMPTYAGKSFEELRQEDYQVLHPLILLLLHGPPLLPFPLVILSSLCHHQNPATPDVLHTTRPECNSSAVPGSDRVSSPPHNKLLMHKLVVPL